MLNHRPLIRVGFSFRGLELVSGTPEGATVYFPVCPSAPQELP